MQRYLDAHADFVRWLDESSAGRTPAEVEKALLDLATCAAGRGMTATHWEFVVDGPIAHARRHCPDNEDLPAFVARGFDLSGRWPAIQEAASGSN